MVPGPRTAQALKLATLSAVKTLEQIDWTAASGTPKAQILELSHLASWRALRTWCCWDQVAWARRTSPWRSAIGQ